MSEYKFRQCPKDRDVKCRYDEDRCGECPIAKIAPAPAARKEIRYEDTGLEPEEIKIRWERTR